jgi:hypothetical protein
MRDWKKCLRCGVKRTRKTRYILSFRRITVVSLSLEWVGMVQVSVSRHVVLDLAAYV